MGSGRAVRWGRRGLCLTALVVWVTAGIAVPSASAAKAKVKPAPSVLSVTTTPALQPGFDPSITDYVSVCNASTPVQVSVGAPAGTSVAVDGHLAQTGTFVVAVTRDVGQGFSFVVTTGSGSTIYYVRCLPADFPPITVQRNGPTQAQYYMVTPFLTTNLAPPPPPISTQYLAIVDSNGVPVWWYNASHQLPPNTPPTDFDLMPDGNLAYTFGGQGGGPIQSGGSYELSLAGKLLHTLNTVGASEDGHDIQMLPNGDFLLDSYPFHTMDLTSIGGSATANVEDAEIQEVTPGGSLVWSWDASAHIPANEMDASLWPQLAGSSPSDLYHLNSVEMDPSNGNIITSLRHSSAVYEFNPTTGNIVWKVGGTTRPESLTLVGDALNGPVGQHDARITAGGVLSLFDNGTQTPGPGGRPARGVRYQIDTVAKTATFIDQVTDPAVGSAGCCGSATRMAGGDWVIGWGLNDRVTETTSTGTPVMTMTFGGSLFTYRAIPIPFGTLPMSALRAGMDAQAPVPTISVGTTSISPGNAGVARQLVFPITLSSPSASPVSVSYSVTPDGTSHTATSPADFQGSVGTTTFTPQPPGNVTPTVQYISVPIKTKSAATTAKSFHVTLFGPSGGYQLGNSIGTGIILGQTPTPGSTLSVGDAVLWNALSGADPIVAVPVTLSRPSGTTTTVVATIGGGSAVNGTDYAAPATETLTFVAGQVEQFVYIAAIPVGTAGASKTVNITLGTPTGSATLVKSTGIVTLGNG
jgi:Arylsulfotransferase (ASST)/Calx-beta domain